MVQSSMRPRVARLLCSVSLALFGVGCAETGAGPVPPAHYALLPFEAAGVDPSIALAIEHAAFFHPECARSGIQVKRVSKEKRFAELLVCGKSRRYQDIAPVVWGESSPNAPTWIEVTSATGT